VLPHPEDREAPVRLARAAPHQLAPTHAHTHTGVSPSSVTSPLHATRFPTDVSWNEQETGIRPCTAAEECGGGEGKGEGEGQGRDGDKWASSAGDDVSLAKEEEHPDNELFQVLSPNPEPLEPRTPCPSPTPCSGRITAPGVGGPWEDKGFGFSVRI
jgi:hypothetical protein